MRIAAKLGKELIHSAVSQPVHLLGASAFATHTQLRSALSFASHLVRSLPIFSLAEDEAAALGDTQIARIVKDGAGQNYLRCALLKQSGRRCPLSGTRNSALLRASHVVP
ncbi:hypothetical protein J3454_15965 [Erythrobacter sp. NFXS35]|uniref:hypothetical protein n=1 Tax=Erythrobacter sp. NFXS35 TaxID=2818436 RepID=UPI0032DF2CCF